MTDVQLKKQRKFCNKAFKRNWTDSTLLPRTILNSANYQVLVNIPLTNVAIETFNKGRVFFLYLKQKFLFYAKSRYINKNIKERRKYFPNSERYEIIYRIWNTNCEKRYDYWSCLSTSFYIFIVRIHLLLLHTCRIFTRINVCINDTRMNVCLFITFR